MKRMGDFNFAHSFFLAPFGKRQGGNYVESVGAVLIFF